MPEPQTSHHNLEPGDAFELPPRHVMSVISPSITDGVLSFANAAQNTPTTQGSATTPTSATSSPLFSQGLSTVTNSAQAAPTAPNGATVQNLNSPNSSGIATTSQG